MNGGLRSESFWPGDTNTITPDDYHRIVYVSSGGVWTLFRTGPRLERGWGFR